MENLAKTGKDSGKILLSGTKIKFHSGEFAGMGATIQSTIPMRYRNEQITYRLLIDGFPKPGGWDGNTTMTAENLMRFANGCV